MKNLLIYVNPEGFDPESEKLIKIQIENSLDLGWRREDILLVTNFKYEHDGIKSTDMGNAVFCTFSKYASKIKAIKHLFEYNLIKKGELYWFHDLDAFQNNVIEESELELDMVDGGFTDYGRKPRWNTGSFFFKESAKDVFDWTWDALQEWNDKFPGRFFTEEHIFNDLTARNFNGINNRIKRLNITYNFGMRRIPLCYEKAVKPLKVLHFHPESKLLNTLAIAMHGKNRLRKPLMSERLIRIFNKYGYV